jgi:hypothetical protein
MFTVWGLINVKPFDDADVELFSSNSQNEAIRWALQYVRGGFGGYDTITVSYLDHRTNWVETILTLGADGSARYEEDYSEQSIISYNL